MAIARMSTEGTFGYDKTATTEVEETKRELSPLEYNFLYISHLDEEFQFWKLPCWPDELTDSMASTFSDTNVLGRTAPVYTYSSSGPRTIQINIPLHRDIMDDLNEYSSNVELLEGEDYVDALMRALQAIALPKYNLTNKLVEPPLIALRVGNDIFIKGVLTDAVGVSYSKPILASGKYARVDISLHIAEVDPYDATQVFAEGGFRQNFRTIAWPEEYKF